MHLHPQHSFATGFIGLPNLLHWPREMLLGVLELWKRKVTDKCKFFFWLAIYGRNHCARSIWLHHQSGSLVDWWAPTEDLLMVDWWLLHWKQVPKAAREGFDTIGSSIGPPSCRRLGTTHHRWRPCLGHGRKRWFAALLGVIVSCLAYYFSSSFVGRILKPCVLLCRCVG